MKTLEECLAEVGKFPFKVQDEQGDVYAVIGFSLNGYFVGQYDDKESDYFELADHDKPLWTLIKEPLRFEWEVCALTSVKKNNIAVVPPLVRALSQGKRFKITAEEIV